MEILTQPNESKPRVKETECSFFCFYFSAFPFRYDLVWNEGKEKRVKSRIRLPIFKKRKYSFCHNRFQCDWKKGKIRKDAWSTKERETGKERKIGQPELIVILQNKTNAYVSNIRWITLVYSHLAFASIQIVQFQMFLPHWKSICSS